MKCQRPTTTVLSSLRGGVAARATPEIFLRRGTTGLLCDRCRSSQDGVASSRHQRGVLVIIFDAIGAALGFQQADDLGVGTGLAEQKALALVAAFGAQAAQLGFGLDAFGGDGDAEALAEADDGADDRLGFAVVPRDRARRSGRS